jgi:hypothetical protein
MEVLWCKANVSAHIPRICEDILYMDALCIYGDMYTHRYINIYPSVKYLCISVCVHYTACGGNMVYLYCMNFRAIGNGSSD